MNSYETELFYEQLEPIKVKQDKYSDAIGLSIAISLKRIADKLDEVTNYCASPTAIAVCEARNLSQY